MTQGMRFGQPCLPGMQGRARSSSPWLTPRIQLPRPLSPDQNSRSRSLPALGPPPFHGTLQNWQPAPPFPVPHWPAPQPLPQQQSFQMFQRPQQMIHQAPTASSPRLEQQGRGTYSDDAIRRALSSLESALSGFERDHLQRNDADLPTESPTSTACHRETPVDVRCKLSCGNAELQCELQWIDKQIEEAAKSRATCEKAQERMAEVRRAVHEGDSDLTPPGKQMWLCVAQRRRIVELERELGESRSAQQRFEEELASEQKCSQTFLEQTQALEVQLKDARQGESFLLEDYRRYKAASACEMERYAGQVGRLEHELGGAHVATEHLEQQVCTHGNYIVDLEAKLERTQAHMACFRESSIRHERQAEQWQTEVTGLRLTDLEMQEARMLQMESQLHEMSGGAQCKVEMAEQRCAMQQVMHETRIDEQVQLIEGLRKQVASLEFERESYADLQKAHRERIAQLEREAVDRARSEVRKQDNSTIDSVRKVLFTESDGAQQSPATPLQRTSTFSFSIQPQAEIPMEQPAPLQEIQERWRNDPRDLGVGVDRVDRSTTAAKKMWVDSVEVKMNTPEKVPRSKSPSRSVFRCGISTRLDLSEVPQPHIQVLQKLESSGWHSVKWNRGYTLLHWAASKGNADLCRYVLDLNGDPQMRDQQSRTPIDLAQKHGHRHALEVLESHALRT